MTNRMDRGMEGVEEKTPFSNSFEGLLQIRR